MKTIIITIKTDQQHHNQKALIYMHSDINHPKTNTLQTELKTNDSNTTQHTDHETIFGSSTKDDFMYRLAISG
jgi:hypothetical protein